MIAIGGLEFTVVALAASVIAAIAGGVAQGSLGFGAAFLLVPVLAVVHPELLPVSMLIAVLPLSVFMVVRSGSDVDVRAVLRITLGRAPGIAAGVGVVALLPIRALTITIAVLLLAAVAASVWAGTLAITSRRELVAGFVSGMTGTAAGLGGPPLAILYRSQSGHLLRSTLPAVWLIGLPLSLGGLALAGEVSATQVQAGLWLSLPVLLGWAIAEPLIRRFDDAVIRAGVLTWAGVGAVMALVRTAVT